MCNREECRPPLTVYVRHCCGVIILYQDILAPQELQKKYAARKETPPEALGNLYENSEAPGSRAGVRGNHFSGQDGDQDEFLISCRKYSFDLMNFTKALLLMRM